jgi:hypothetical protein
MTPALGAMQVLNERTNLNAFVTALAERAQDHSKDMQKDESDRLRLQVRGRCQDLLDSWAKEAQDYQAHGVGLQYNPQETGGAKQLLYDFLSPELKTLPPTNPKMKFRANRSLRDVEAAVNIWVKTLDNVDLEDETE